MIMNMDNPTSFGQHIQEPTNPDNPINWLKEQKNLQMPEHWYVGGWMI